MSPISDGVNLLEPAQRVAAGVKHVLVSGLPSLELGTLAGSLLAADLNHLSRQSRAAAAALRRSAGASRASDSGDSPSGEGGRPDRWDCAPPPRGPVRSGRLPCDRSRPPMMGSHEMTLRTSWVACGRRDSDDRAPPENSDRRRSIANYHQVYSTNRRTGIGHWLSPILPWLCAGRPHRLERRSDVQSPISGSCDGVIECIGQGVDDVAGDHADDAVLVAGDVAGQTVDVDAELGGLERLAASGR